MDDDGSPEILIGNRNERSVEIWAYSLSTGSLYVIDTISGFPHDIHDVKAADFDKDGDMDVVVGLRFSGLYLAKNMGTPGPLGSWSITRLGSGYSWQVFVEDFDQDGNLDIMNSADGGSLQPFYGDGNCNFAAGTAITTSPQSSGRGYNVLYLDGDAYPDVIGTDPWYLRAHLNNGNRTWSSIGPSAPIANSSIPQVLRVLLQPSAADLDGDGLIEQIMLLCDKDANNVKLLVMEGDPSGGSWVWTQRVLDTLPGALPYWEWTLATGIADLNDDGNLDIVVAGLRDFNGLHIYLGDGTGNYTYEFLDLDHGVADFNCLVVGDIDGDGDSDIVTTRWASGTVYSGFEVLFQNQPPVADAGGPYVVALGNSIGIDGSGSSDPDGDALTFAWTPVTYIDDPALSNPAYTGNLVGVEELTLTVDDGAQSASDTTYVVTYDPTGGFVTGGGWIWSPEGACQFEGCSEDTTGKASFGFVSKYKKGAEVPTGQTQFQFKAGNLNFHSDSYDWLVIAGAKAMYKGVGTINGAGNYGFMLSAVDAALTPSTDVDLFHIKIWNRENSGAVVYDNQMDAEEDADPTTAIGGGSIVIHKSK